MGVHIVGFFVFMIVLWVTSEHAPARQVFTEFQDNGGWGNTGLSALVGITTPLWSFLGPDAGAHMSEELRDASRVLPSAMMWGSLFNALLGLVMLITLCFCLGPDWQDNVLGLTNPTQTGIPIIQVLYNSTQSIAATTFMTTILILLSMVGTITCIASSSRQVWAFARDKGFPFSSYIEYVSHFSCFFCLISFGSRASRQQVNTLQRYGQAGTYLSTQSSWSYSSPCSSPPSISAPTSP